MSIAPILLAALPQVQAAEFDVGAGVEGVAALDADAVGLGLRQVEVDARLGLGSVAFRLDLDAVAEPVVMPGGLWPQSDAARPRLYPEWAAVDMVAANGWTLAGGLRPLDSAGEALDGWNSPIVPHSASFTALWPGSLLGAWAALDGGASPSHARLSAWGGVRTGPALAPSAEQAVLGAGLGLGEGQLAGDLALSVLPLQQHATLTGSLALDLGEPAQITGATWVTGWPTAGAADAIRVALLTTVIGLPERPLSPVGRAEWSPGAGSSGLVMDGGLRWRPQSFVQLAATARLAGDTFGMYAGLAFFEDPEAR